MAPKRFATKRSHREIDAIETTIAAEKHAGAPLDKMPEKKTKLERAMAGVEKCIEDADLNDACRSMLLALVPASLGSVAEERQELQCLAVTMLGSVFEDQRAALQTAVRDEEAKLTEIEAGHGGLKAKISAAEEAVAERQAVVDVRKKALVACSQEFVSAKAAAAEAKEAQRQHEVTVTAIEEEKKAVESATAEHFRPIKEEGCEIMAAQAHIAVILPLARKMKLDSSLISAMPSSCSKKPSDRGPFDQMVIAQLDEMLVAKVTELAEQLEAKGKEVVGLVASAEAAQQKADGAKERQQQAASEVMEAQAAQRERAAVLEDALAEARNFEPSYLAATAVLKDKKALLESFESWNVKCFESLRDRTATTPEEQLAPFSAPVLAVGGQ